MKYRQNTKGDILYGPPVRMFFISLKSQNVQKIK